MPIDNLPGALIIPQRDEIRDDYLRDVRIRTPGAVTLEGTLEFADASVFADTQVAVYYDAKTIGDYVANVNKTGAALDAELKLAGTKRLGDAGGSGFVLIGASGGGGTIFAEDEIKDAKSGLRFKCTVTGLYTDGQYVPITGVDTGPSTNLDALSTMKWSFPRPGISPTATVVQQSDGSGLTGGRNAETDAQANDRLAALRASPPASGNDADYQKATQETPGITIQQAFTYPCIRGPGTMGVTFTLRPGTPGANRIPNATQLATVLAWLIGKFPADDGILVCSLLGFSVNIVYKVSWSGSAVSWADAAPWPPYIPSDMVIVDNSVAPTATTFRLVTGTSTVNPTVGSTIAFYDQKAGVFRRKRILTVTTLAANHTWDIVCDIVNNASDTTYTPFTGQAPGPWSDSLQVLVPDTTAYFDTLGPGEQLSVIPDPNLRARRTPRSPSVYANKVTNRITSPLFKLAAVNDIELAFPTVPFSTPVGYAGVVSYLLQLGSMTVFPQ